MLCTATQMNLTHAMLSEKKPITKGHTLYDAIYLKSLEQKYP